MTSTPTNPLMSAEEVRRQDVANSQPLPEAIDKGKARLSDPQKLERLRAALEAIEAEHAGAVSVFLKGTYDDNSEGWIVEDRLNAIRDIARQVLKETE